MERKKNKKRPATFAVSWQAFMTVAAAPLVVIY